MALILALILTTAVVQQAPAERRVPVEVFQIIELPITIADTTLIKTKDGYLLKCRLSNNSEFPVLGLRYALAVVDSMNATIAIISKNEGLTLAEFQTKNLTFKTPIKLKMKSDERLVLMLEQIISTDYVWDVMKSSEALRVYLSGDYSVPPRVLRSLNQIDAPIRIEVIH